MPRQFARGRARKPVAGRLAMQKPLRGSAIEDGNREPVRLRSGRATCS